MKLKRNVNRSNQPEKNFSKVIDKKSQTQTIKDINKYSWKLETV